MGRNNNFNLKLFAFFLSFLAIGNSIGNCQNSEFVSKDFIKTAVCYGYNGSGNFAERILNSPIANLNTNDAVFIEFDDLRADYTQFRAKIKHCTQDWKTSNLAEIEFLEGYNEFIINDYDVSISAKTPYYHYRFKIPKLKISGNFIIQIFENRISNEPIIQKKFIIADLQTAIQATILPAQDPQIWKSKQQINFEINFGNYNIGFPQRELAIYIRQNQRDDKTIKINNKLMYNKGNNSVGFNFNNNENTFLALNEFRFINISSSVSNNNSEESTINEINIPMQFSRNKKGYVNAADRNGGFVVYNLSNEDTDMGSDYVKVKFRFSKADNPLIESPILLSKFNNFDKNEGSMDFNELTNSFEKEVMLKNGFYDYFFTSKSAGNEQYSDENIEGSFSDTENNYEIFVYHLAPNLRYQPLIGYIKINSTNNNR